jgi:hypothetical protein
MKRHLEYIDPCALVAWIRAQAERETITGHVADILVESVAAGCRDWEKGVPVMVIRAELGWSPPTEEMTP